MQPGPGEHPAPSPGQSSSHSQAPLWVKRLPPTPPGLEVKAHKALLEEQVSRAAEDVCHLEIQWGPPSHIGWRASWRRRGARDLQAAPRRPASQVGPFPGAEGFPVPPLLLWVSLAPGCRARRPPAPAGTLAGPSPGLPPVSSSEVPGGQLHCRPPSPPVCQVSGVFVLAALRAVYELCLNSLCQCPVSGSGPFCPWKCHAPLDFRVRAPWGLRCLMGPEDLLICRGSVLCCVVG